MYEHNPRFLTPDDPNVKIWRYMDIPKFLSLLDKQALFFSRSDLLGDPFEGSIPIAEGQINLTEFIQKSQMGEIQDIPINQLPFSIHDMFRKSSYICSFHINPYESAALWSIYAKTKQGVAIQSTFSRLCKSFENYQEDRISISQIKYIDYSTQTIPVLENAYLPLIHKMKSFEYEQELRALITFPKHIIDPRKAITKQSLENNPRGILIPVNLNELIENVYIAPTSPDWIKELLESISQKFQFEKKILRSNLDSNPIL